MKQSWGIIRRVRAASARDNLVSVATALSKAYVALFGVYLPASKYSRLPDPSIKWVIGFAIATVLSVALPLIPKVKSRKWKNEELRRTSAMGVAISSIANAIIAGGWEADQRSQTLHGILQAMKSEIEALTVDSEGIYLNVSLLLEVNDHLEVISRAVMDRPNPRYPSQSLQIYNVLQTKRSLYLPEFEQEGKPYKCILAVPLVHATGVGNESALTDPPAILSLDSAQVHYFDSVEKEISSKLLVYLSLLKLVLAVKG